MTTDPTIVAARARAAAAKAQLDVSVAHAKARLNPRSLASDAVESATDKASQVAQTGMQVARERPAVAAAVAGAVGLALVRKPLLKLVRSMFRRQPEAVPDDGISLY